jgi:hypothetical protein
LPGLLQDDDLEVELGERCLVTQNSDLTMKARKKWTLRASIAAEFVFVSSG